MLLSRSTRVVISSSERSLTQTHSLLRQPLKTLQLQPTASATGLERLSKDTFRTKASLLAVRTLTVLSWPWSLLPTKSETTIARWPTVMPTLAGSLARTSLLILQAILMMGRKSYSSLSASMVTASGYKTMSRSQLITFALLRIVMLSLVLSTLLLERQAIAIFSLLS